MKKLLTLSLLIFSITSHAQWTDNGTDITTTDKVGIGTTSPSANIHIVASQTIGIPANLNNGFIKLSNNTKTLVFDPNQIYASKELYFQTTGNNPLIFHTNDTERMRILGNGLVGIGISTPKSKLEVRGSIRSSINDARYVVLHANGDGNSYYNYQGGDVNSRIGFQINGSSKMSIHNNGNVGIGTSTPFEKLQVVSSSSNEIVWPVVANNPYNNSTTNEYGVGIKLKHSSNNETWKWSGIASVNEGSWANNSGLALYSDGTEKVRIKHDGSVGIGTNQTFGYKLAVNGTIASKEVKVETTSAWPDFVFASDYKLPSLDEVKEFIAQNNHLPEIPSEAEVLEEGINLGEMNAKLLQKIEELTLYTINQQKLIETQGKMIEELNSIVRKKR